MNGAKSTAVDNKVCLRFKLLQALQLPLQRKAIGAICMCKGAGVFGRPGQNMEDLGVFGTSRSSNELKSVPRPPCQLRLMKRYFWSHKISHLWLKIGLFKAIFDLFLQVFCSTDHIYAYFKLEMDQELPYTYGKVG